MQKSFKIKDRERGGLQQLRVPPWRPLGAPCVSAIVVYLMYIFICLYI